jgi:uroporphyrinogen decarboxylase
MRKIISELQGRAGSPLPADGAHGVTRPTNVPIIAFSLGTYGNWNDLAVTSANVLGIDWQFSLAEARKILPEKIGIQGNLNPALLAEATPEKVAAETNHLLEEMRGRNGYIFNLGHGVPPTAKLENIAALVETVRSFK